MLARVLEPVIVQAGGFGPEVFHGLLHQRQPLGQGPVRQGRKPFLRISSAADMIIGKQKDGLLGRCVDVFFILGLLFCTAVTMCISLPTVEGAGVRHHALVRA